MFYSVLSEPHVENLCRPSFFDDRFGSFSAGLVFVMYCLTGCTGLDTAVRDPLQLFILQYSTLLAFRVRLAPDVVGCLLHGDSLAFIFLYLLYE